MADLRVPPGRAGRLWLRHRLAVAERGVGLLEQKLRVLQAAQQRLRDEAERAERVWLTSAAEADLWGLRAGLAGGQRSLRMAAPHERAEVHLPWVTVMGVRYPGDASCAPPTGEPGDGVVTGSAAVVRARTAYELALQAAVCHAAGGAAVRVVDAEITTTRQRQRALRKHWIPRLRQALIDVELALEEQDRAEAVRRRWAATTSGRDQT